MAPTAPLLAALALLAVAAAPPLATAAFEEWPLLATAGYDQPGWAAWRVRVGPDHFLVPQVQGVAEEAPVAAMGLWVLRADGALVDGGVLTAASGGPVELHAHAGATGLLASHSDGGLSSPLPDVPVPLTLPEGEYLVVAFAAADGGIAGTFSLRGMPGAEVLGATEGSGAFLLRERHFEGTATAYANAPGVRAKAVLDGSVGLEAQGTLFAVYHGRSNTGQLAMALETPAQLLQGERTYWLNGAPAGSYRLHLDNLDLRAMPMPQPLVVATGADVALP